MYSICKPSLELMLQLHSNGQDVADQDTEVTLKDLIDAGMDDV